MAPGQQVDLNQEFWLQSLTELSPLASLTRYVPSSVRAWTEPELQNKIKRSFWPESKTDVVPALMEAKVSQINRL